jgi:hypothetical protein
MGATWAAMAAAAAARSRVRVRHRSADFTTWASSRRPGVVDLGQNLDSLALKAAAADAYALGVAGTASGAADSTTFVCVPAGMRNHFAFDVGVDRHDLIGALDAFTGGVEREIDMAEVNGRTFVNDASVGIYGDAVSRLACRYATVRTLLGTAVEVMGPSAEAPALDPVDDLGARAA